jgi:hypothetical protein
MKVYVGEVTVRIPFASVDKGFAQDLHRLVVELLSQRDDKISPSVMEVCISGREMNL